MLTLTGSVMVAACAERPQRAADELRDAAGSWAATLKLATDQWARGALPTRFVLSTTATAVEELQREVHRVRAKAGGKGTAPADEVLARIPSLNAAVAAENRSAATDIARRLADVVPATPTRVIARPQ